MSQQDDMLCSKCGAVVENGRFCSQCGANLQEEMSRPQRAQQPSDKPGTFNDELKAGWRRQPTWVKAASAGGAVLLLVIIVAAALSGGDGDGGSNSRSTPPGGDGGGGGSGASSESVEYKLAVVDEGGYVDTDDPLVGQFKSVLDALTPKCTETRQKIADMGVVAHGLLEEKGITLSLLRVMQDVNRSIPADFGTQPCADIFAAYVVLQ